MTLKIFLFFGDLIEVGFLRQRSAEVKVGLFQLRRVPEGGSKFLSKGAYFEAKCV